MFVARTSPMPAALIAAAMLLPCVAASAGLVDIEFSPPAQTVAVCDVVEIDILVSTSDGAGQAFAAMEVILVWDAAVLELLGVDQSGAGTPLFVSDFLPDPDGINLDFTDGDAIYTALAPPGNPAIAPGQPDMLVVTTVQFRALQLSGPTTLAMLRTLGAVARTQVLLSSTDYVGDISSTSETTVGDSCAPDIDGDGQVGFPDLLIVLSTWGACAGCCPGDIDNDGTVGFVDLLLVLSLWGPCL